MNTSGEAVSWGTDGYAAYIEYYSSDEACGVGYIIRKTIWRLTTKRRV